MAVMDAWSTTNATAQVCLINSDVYDCSDAFKFDRFCKSTLRSLLSDKPTTTSISTQCLTSKLPQNSICLAHFGVNSVWPIVEQNVSLDLQHLGNGVLFKSLVFSQLRYDLTS